MNKYAICTVYDTVCYQLPEFESSIHGHEENKRPKNTMNYHIAVKVLNGIITYNSNSVFC